MSKKEIKILIVEDDAEIADNLELFFRHHQFQTLLVDDGADVVPQVLGFKPELIIMDIMLPNKDGIQCCKEVRSFSNVPIIMLTAKVEQTDKYLGLESGADDYICKPFDVMELILRVKSLLNRSQGKVSFSKVSVLPDQGKVFYKDTEIDLSTLEYNLFFLLYSNPNRIYSREQILHLAYPQYRHITDRTIDSHVKKIRNKFKNAGVVKSPIESIYGAGYRYSLN